MKILLFLLNGCVLTFCFFEIVILLICCFLYTITKIFFQNR